MEKVVDIIVMGRKTTAIKAHLKKVDGVRDACFCPKCKKVMNGFNGVYHCWLDGYFVQDFSAI